MGPPAGRFTSNAEPLLKLLPFIRRQNRRKEPGNPDQLLLGITLPGLPPRPRTSPAPARRKPLGYLHRPPGSGSTAPPPQGLKPSAFVRSRLGLDVDVIEVDQHDGVQQEVGAPAPAPVDPPASAFLEGCCRLCGVPLVLRISPWLWFRKLVSQRGRVVSLRSGLSGSILFRVTDSDPASGHHYECSHPH